MCFTFMFFGDLGVVMGHVILSCAMAFSYYTSTRWVKSLKFSDSGSCLILARCGFVAVKHKETVAKLSIFTVPWEEITSCMIQNDDSHL